MKWNKAFPTVSQVTCLLKNIIVVRHLLRLEGIGKPVYIVYFPWNQILSNEIQWDIFVPGCRNLLLHMKRFVTIFDQRKAVFSVKNDRVVDWSCAYWLAIAINQGTLRLGINRVFAGNTTRIHRSQKGTDQPGPNPKFRFRPKQCASFPCKGRILFPGSVAFLPCQGQSQPWRVTQKRAGGTHTP